MSGPRPSDAAVTWVTRLAAAVLRSERGDPFEPPDNSHLEADDAVSAIFRHRLTALITSHPEAMGAVPSDPARLLAARRAEQLRVMRSVRTLHEVGESLDQAGIRWLTMKGPALAYVTTGDFTARGAGDVDIWISADDLASAVIILLDHGWSNASGVPEPGESWAWRHFHAMGSELALTRGGAVLDLHWHLSALRDLVPTFAEAWQRHTVVQLDQVRTPTLGDEDALTHTCVHAHTDQYRWLRSVVDLWRLTQRNPLNLSSPIQRSAAAILETTFDTPGDHLTTQQAQREFRTVRRALAAQRAESDDGDVTPGLRTLTHLSRLDRRASVQDRSRYLANMLLPPTLVRAGSSRAAIALPHALANRAGYAAARLRGAR